MKQLKAFIPYRLNSDSFFKWLGKLAATKEAEATLDLLTTHKMLATDPIGSQWGTLGLVAHVDVDRPIHDLDGTARMLVYQFNDRILPGAVINEKLVAAANDLCERQGFMPGKKAMAELRDQVEDQLLPSAFIRRTLVPVLVYPNALLICTASAKKADDVFKQVMTLARMNVKVNFDVEGVHTKASPAFTLRQLATCADDIGNLSDAGYAIQPGGAIKLRGEDKRVSTFKDHAVASDDVQKLLEDTYYAVTELALDALNVDGELECSFAMSDRLIFKSIKLSGTNTAGLEKSDRHATAWIHAKVFKRLLDTMVECMGGEAVSEDDEF